MQMTEKPLFKKIMQVGLVVRDVDASVRKQWDEFGIGPWAIYTFDPSKVKNLTVRGKPVEHAMRVAIAMIGDLMWELIQPLDEKSIYAEFLKEHGEGIHHVLFDVDDFSGAEAHFRRGGHELCQGGQMGKTRYAYFDTRETLHTIAEIVTFSQDEAPPPPEATYP
jgi:Glyoxalase/Bleomycin resistance protein/Dioxygenase superfamily